MKKLISPLFVILSLSFFILTGLFLVNNIALATSISPSSQKKISENTFKNTTMDIQNTRTNQVTSLTPPTENNNTFVKIGDEIIPIDYNIFSSKKTSLQYTTTPKHYPEIENITLCPEDKSKIITICNRTFLLKDRLNFQTKETFNIDKKALETYLTTLKESSKKIARNAHLSADKNGHIKVVKKEEYGYEININQTLKNIPKYFNSSPQKVTTLPIKKISPIITSTNYEELGLKQKIGSGQSNFHGSPKNRIHNIHNATSKFEGILIAPDEIFSFIENLGDVDENTGYKEELVIKNNKTIPEFGGGVCQVSTTLFRAAVNTGLEITERRNHAYKVSYYSPQGTDATVYIPKPDLQFKNNTSKYIMLQPHIEGTVLTFDIFGTSDGRQVTTEGPTLLEKKDNGDSKYVWWQIINDKDGNQVSKKGFWSYYQNAAKFHENHTEQIHRTKPKGWSNSEWKRYKNKYW